MPKDDWGKARAKDAVRRARRDRPPRKRGRRPATLPKTNAWNPNSVLWFGRYRGTPVCNVPRSYLLWLASQPACLSWQINALCEYLRRYLTQTRPPLAKVDRAKTQPAGEAPRNLAIHEVSQESA